MPITANRGRQEVISAAVDFTFASFDANDGTQEEAILLPEGAVVIGGRISITTAFDGTTSDTIDVGDLVDDDEYLAGVDAQALGMTVLVPTGLMFALPTWITLGNTNVGGVATVGAGRLEVEYRVNKRACFNQE